MAVALKDVEQLLPASFERRKKMVARDKPVLIFPGIRSDDPTYRRFAYDLYQALEKRVPRSAVEKGIYKPPGSPGGWEKLLNVPGYLMNPSGTPTGTQGPDVPVQWESPADEKLFRLIVRKLYPHGTPADFSSRRDASTMHPHYTKDPAVKLKSLKSGLLVVNRHLEKAFKANKPEELAAEFGFWIKHDKATREQQDGATFDGKRWLPKERVVTDYFGKRVVADKSLQLPGVKVPHWRSRGRIAYGTSATANYPLVAIAACMRRVPYERYGFTYHHQDGESIKTKMKARPRFRRAIPLDVKNFDQHQPPMMVSAFIEELPLSPQAKLLSSLISQGPVGANQDYLGESGYRSIGNPLDFRTFKLRHGNPSGWALNDLLNAAVGTFVCLRIGEYSGAIKLRADRQDLVDDCEATIDSVLEGSHPRYAFLNKGDDSILWFSEDSEHAKAFTFLEAGGRIYLEVELEAGARFLGNVFVQDGDTLAVLPDITSYAIRELNPEYAWASPKRPYAAHGHFERQAYYGRHPLFTEVKAVIEEVFSSHYSVGLDAMLEPHLVRPQGLELLNFAEAEFMVNPAAVHYKIDVADIRRDLQDKFFVHVPWAELQPWVQPLFEVFEA